MSLDTAVRATEVLIALAFLQQSIEHLQAPADEQRLFLARLALSILLLCGFQTAWVCVALLLLGLVILKRFQGPYNGGCDRMGLLILCCLTLVHVSPALGGAELAFGYLALQLVMSYAIAGWAKIVNPDWRRGLALRDVFRFSVYPVSESLRGWADWPRLLWLMSWAVIIFELAFPLALLTRPTLILALAVAAIFHLANACLFGLNRFFWIWLAAYPSILWFQQRIVQGFQGG